MANTNKYTPVYVAKGSCFTPLGLGAAKNLSALLQHQIAIQKIEDKEIHPTPFYGAKIAPELLDKEWEKLSISKSFRKLEKMMLIATQSIISNYKNRLEKNCGVIFSTTKGNIDALADENDADYYLQSLAKKVTKALGLSTDPIVLSNACVSGVMAVSVAKRMIQVGQYDHVIVISGDLFSRFVFSGFQSFQAVSDQPCKPYSKGRSGITLGEAAASVLVTKDKQFIERESLYEVVGDSSINDANHISGPSRTGEGLYRSIQNALNEAKVNASVVDVISSHGTATEYNDEMEAQAYTRAGLEKIPMYSLKGCYGHTLGAAGLLETIIALAAADKNTILPSYGYEEHGLELPLAINREVKEANINYVLKTASGFGGTNTAVLFKKEM